VSTIAVSGYATFDYAMALCHPLQVNQTAVVKRRLSHPWPRQGGCAPNIARGLLAEGHQAALVTWLGSDDLGSMYLNDLRLEGIGVEGVEIMVDARTACTYLLYDDDGSTSCILDMSDHVSTGLTESQWRVLNTADWMCVTVGPRHATSELLTRLRPDIPLVFSVKADHDAFPPQLMRKCLERAAIVALNNAERGFLEASVGAGYLRQVAKGGTIFIETRGAHGVRIVVAGAEEIVPVKPVIAKDTTGAGDRFLAAVIAALANSQERYEPKVVKNAVRSGIAAARTYLLA